MGVVRSLVNNEFILKLYLFCPLNTITTDYIFGLIHISSSTKLFAACGNVSYDEIAKSIDFDVTVVKKNIGINYINLTHNTSPLDKIRYDSNYLNFRFHNEDVISSTTVFNESSNALENREYAVR